METVDPSVTSTSTTLDMSLHFPRPPMEGASKVLQFPLCHIAHNTTARAALDYSIVDNLTQYPTTMSTLEVLKTCPSQCKEFLSALSAVDPSNSRLIINLQP